MINLEQDAAEQQANQSARFSLEDLVGFGEKLEQLNLAKGKLEIELETINTEIVALETEILPEGLKLLGIKDLTLSSGARISLSDVISASITDDNRDEAHQWLRDNNHGDLIKNNVTLTFGKGEDTAAKELINRLLQLRNVGETSFGQLQQKEAVHPSTLKAFVRQRVESGEAFPGKLFKLYTGQVVKIAK